MWKSRLHSCGHHLDDTVDAYGRKAGEFVPLMQECRACEALEKQQRKKAKEDTDDTIRHHRVWTVVTQEEADRLRKEAEKALQQQ